ncbi:helix-hairpin-helix domain-containing protein [Oceanirhabdus seepicola]|uniref:Helix-hairpin-helix domain-containing protein n=1 Tax=Oceanirhabdus seepicola TaxID=2828781 RepID=A0A9J6P2K7_9CLOT|nr:helix-hairpin-helix domain-containing protein [Oceanirhabdus seepicola]MCM1990747.1 helix-hairpin-helix domain-containing protein [Oceanirhabdus seepicola]
MRFEIKDKIILGLVSMIIVISTVGVIRYLLIKEQSPRVEALKRDKYFMEEYKPEKDILKDNKSKEGESREVNLTVVNNKGNIKKITVDIEGAVKKPGVYTVDEDLRLDNLIKTAGGLKEIAETKGLNKAMKLQDEGYYYIFSIGEEDNGEIAVYNSEGSYSTTEESASHSGDRKININTASIERLQLIPGIGEVKAVSIVEYREKNGGFKSVEELKNISGIGEKTFEKLRDYIDIR